MGNHVDDRFWTQKKTSKIHEKWTKIKKKLTLLVITRSSHRLNRTSRPRLSNNRNRVDFSTRKSFWSRVRIPWMTKMFKLKMVVPRSETIMWNLKKRKIWKGSNCVWGNLDLSKSEKLIFEIPVGTKVWENTRNSTTNLLVRDYS